VLAVNLWKFKVRCNRLIYIFILSLYKKRYLRKIVKSLLPEVLRKPIILYLQENFFAVARLQLEHPTAKAIKILLESD
jgi:hypothetical protein